MSNLTSELTTAAPTADPGLAAMVSDTRFVIQRVLTPMVMLVGVIGNLVSIIVLTRRRMRSSTNSYLTALAVSDTLYLAISFTLSLKHSVPGISHPDFRIYWHYWPFGLWLIDAASNTSTWLTVTFTVERYVAVCHPIRGQVYCTESRARKMICIVYLFCFLVTLSTPFEWEIAERLNHKTNSTEMTAEFSELGMLDEYRHAFYVFTATMFIFLPLVLLAIFNSFLILAVKESRKQRAVLCSGESQSQRQENKITIMLISVVIIYMLCQLPHACMLVYLAVTGEVDSWTDEFQVRRILGNIFNFLMAINAACNFVLYCALSDKYRKTFLVTFCRCWYQPPAGLPSGIPTAYSNVSDFSRTGSPRSSCSKRSSVRSQRSLNGARGASVRGRTGSPPDHYLGVPGSRGGDSQGLLEASGGPAPAGGRGGPRRARPPRLPPLPAWLRFGRDGKARRHNIVITTPDGSQEEGVTAV
ncbi:FMRFamide receptor-like [Pollicipes pollicipes]|uniref:FMRFamide receptor-like n=1 Tax=Pollicipes pollicipes TaxID=41117 RepID=UPI0018858A56|nr:FMRFamide receptor-like [Pollicipes pollicipes]